MSKKLSKQKLNDIITYGIVIAAFIIMQILINAGEKIGRASCRERV